MRRCLPRPLLLARGVAPSQTVLRSWPRLHSPTPPRRSSVATHLHGRPFGALIPAVVLRPPQRRPPTDPRGASAAAGLRSHSPPPRSSVATQPRGRPRGALISVAVPRSRRGDTPARPSAQVDDRHGRPAASAVTSPLRRSRGALISAAADLRSPPSAVGFHVLCVLSKISRKKNSLLERFWSHFHL